MNHLNFSNANKIKNYVLKAGYPAINIVLGDVHVVQVKLNTLDHHHRENFFEALNKVAGSRNYGWMPIMDGILITAADWME